MIAVSLSVRLSNANFWSELLVYVKSAEEYPTDSRHSISSLPLLLALWIPLSGERLSVVITAKHRAVLLLTQR